MMTTEEIREKVVLDAIEDCRKVFEMIVFSRAVDNRGEAFRDDHHRFLGVFNNHFPKKKVQGQ